jgi:hypothetical protein
VKVTERFEVVSGPEILIPFNQADKCRICSLPELHTPDALLNHYVSVHEFPVVADYLFDGVRYIELDKHNQCSERSKQITGAVE